MDENAQVIQLATENLVDVWILRVTKLFTSKFSDEIHNILLSHSSRTTPWPSFPLVMDENVWVIQLATENWIDVWILHVTKPYLFTSKLSDEILNTLLRLAYTFLKTGENEETF